MNGVMLTEYPWHGRVHLRDDLLAMRDRRCAKVYRNTEVAVTVFIRWGHMCQQTVNRNGGFKGTVDHGYMHWTIVASLFIDCLSGRCTAEDGIYIQVTVILRFTVLSRTPVQTLPELYVFQLHRSLAECFGQNPGFRSCVGSRPSFSGLHEFYCFVRRH